MRGSWVRGSWARGWRRGRSSDRSRRWASRRSGCPPSSLRAGAGRGRAHLKALGGRGGGVEGPGRVDEEPHGGGAAEGGGVDGEEGGPAELGEDPPPDGGLERVGHVADHVDE